MKEFSSSAAVDMLTVEEKLQCKPSVVLVSGEERRSSCFYSLFWGHSSWVAIKQEHGPTQKKICFLTLSKWK